MAVYIDTSALIALHEPRDKHHEAAVLTLRRLQERKEPLIVGWHTFVEFLDGLEKHYDQATAAQSGTKILTSPRIRVVGTESQREPALRLLVERTDWKVDLSDCISFAFIAAKRIRGAFTYDQDFSKPGIPIVG